MDTFISFFVAALVTLFFVRRYVRGLHPARAAAGVAPVSVAARPCPRCNQPVPDSSSFCGACGAPMALWTVHREAAIAAPTNGAATAPKAGAPTPVINATMCIGCGSCVDACPEEGTLALVAGKAILANPSRCVGHADCVKACPTQAIVLSFGGVRQTLRVPSVNERFETNVPGLYIVGELGGLGLIKTAINEGRLVIDTVRERLAQEPAAPAASGHVYDVLIVGAGPAGLSAALRAHEFELDYIAVEQGEIAATIRNYPRQKFLMSEPVEMPLYGPLWVADTTKEALLAVWDTIVANTGVHVAINTRVQNVRRADGIFYVETSAGEFVARKVVLATGKRGSPRKLEVPGEGLPKVAYRLIEAESYEGQHILIVGGGDSAIEAALALAKGGRNRVTLSHRRDTFERARERNRAQLAAAEKEGRITVLRRSRVVAIRPEDVVLESGGREVVLPNAYLFVLIGGESPEDFLQRLGVAIVEKSIGALPAVPN